MTTPEPILEPDLLIVEAHHHLCVREPQTCLRDESLVDFATGHRIE